jgi:monoamine oxidase
LKACAELNVALVRPAGGPPEAPALAIGDKVMAQSAWAAAVENPFPQALRAVAPQALLARLAGEGNPLAEITDWATPAAFARDQSATDFLTAKGVDAAGRRLIDIGLNANALDTYSMLNVWRTLTLFAKDREFGPVQLIRDGSQRVADAMAASLSREVMLNAQVQTISTSRRGVSVRLADGRSFKAPAAICTLPFPVLRNLSLNAPLSPAQRGAIAGLPYTQILQLHFSVEGRFWEADGLSPDMWTDGPLERIFAGRDRETRTPNGLFLAWINGDAALRLAAQSDDALNALLQKEMARLRPASAGKVRLHRIIQWTAQNPYAGGAYMHFAPGQAERWALQMGEPAGRLHFAGEHLSYLHTGMEGAMEAGERAAAALL